MASAALKEVVEIDYGPIIEEAKAQHSAKQPWSNNASGTFITTDGEISDTEHSVCHHYLGGYYAKYMINGLQDGRAYGDNPGRILPKEVELWFVDYILNRSPYAITFVEKDAVKALETRLTVSSGDHPGNLVAGGVVALRRLWEHVYVARAAYDLVQLGVNEDLAFIIGHTIQSPSKIDEHTQVSWTANLNWHTSVDPGVMGFKAIKNFLNHELLHPGQWYVTSGVYRGYSNMFGADGGLLECIKRDFPVHLYNGQAKAVDNNPFAAAKLPEPKGNAKTAPYPKAIEVMAEWAKTHLMEKINAA